MENVSELRFFIIHQNKGALASLVFENKAMNNIISTELILVESEKNS